MYDWNLIHLKCSKELAILRLLKEKKKTIFHLKKRLSLILWESLMAPFWNSGTLRWALQPSDGSTLSPPGGNMADVQEQQLGSTRAIYTHIESMISWVRG